MGNARPLHHNMVCEICGQEWTSIPRQWKTLGNAKKTKYINTWVNGHFSKKHPEEYKRWIMIGFNEGMEVAYFEKPPPISSIPIFEAESFNAEYNIPLPDTSLIDTIIIEHIPKLSDDWYDDYEIGMKNKTIQTYDLDGNPIPSYVKMYGSGDSELVDEDEIDWIVNSEVELFIEEDNGGEVRWPPAKKITIPEYFDWGFEREYATPKRLKKLKDEAESMGLLPNSRTFAQFTDGELETDAAIGIGAYTAHRHNNTNYDELLQKGYSKEMARELMESENANLQLRDSQTRTLLAYVRAGLAVATFSLAYLIYKR